MNYFRLLILITLLVSNVLNVIPQNDKHKDIVVSELPFLKKLPTNEVLKTFQDSQGYIWVGTTNGLFRFDGYDVIEFKSDYKTPELLPSNHINCISESDEYIFAGTNNGLCIIDKNTLKVSVPEIAELKNQNIECILYDNDQRIWISIPNRLYRFDKKLNHRDLISINKNKSLTASSLYLDHNNELWAICWRNGLYRYDKQNDSFKEMPKIGKYNNPFKMLLDSNGNFWITTWGDGLYRFYPDSENGEYFVRQKLEGLNNENEDSIIFGIEQDNRYGYLWLLSYHRLMPVNIDGDKAEILDIFDTSVNKMFSSIFKDKSGNLWLGAYDSGINVCFKDDAIESFDLEDIVSALKVEVNINALNKDGDNIYWINQERVGLRFFNPETKEVSISGNKRVNIFEADKIEKYGTGNEMIVSSSYIPWLYRLERKGTELIIKDSTDLGKTLNYFGKISDFEVNEDKMIGAILSKRFLLIDNKNNIYNDEKFSSVSAMCKFANDGFIISNNNNIEIVSLDNGKITSGKVIYSDPKLINGEIINNIACNESENIVFSTNFGRIFNIQKDNITTELTDILNQRAEIILNLSFKNDIVNILLGNEVIRYNITNSNIEEYKNNDVRVPVNTFKRNAFCIDPVNDNIYAGGHKGFITIFENHGNKNDIAGLSKPVISDIKIGEESIFSGLGKKHEFNISDNKISLMPKDNKIEIFFADLYSLTENEKRYYYKMDGIDSDWIICENNINSASYNNLGKGDYKFRVKTGSEETVFNITKEPFWYESNVAYFIYFILIILVTVILLRYYSYRIETKNKLKFKKEITQTKIDYFTNISHELLTPLAILSCVSDNIELDGKTEPDLLQAMKENINRLNKLIKQVLEFRKIDAGKLSLAVSYYNVSDTINKIVSSGFELAAREKNISLIINIEKMILGYIDKDKLEMIVYNIMSNAVKYTDEGKNIFIEVFSGKSSNKHKDITIKIKDEGIGIDTEEIKNIFTCFYVNRNNTGADSNGIGLSVTNEIVKLHHGTIDVKSEKGLGSTFIVSVPIDKESYSEEDIIKEHPINNNDISGENKINNPDAQSLLIIDDNPVLLTLISKTLSYKYNVVCCRNGNDVGEILNKENIDLILCDIMMPEINGLELCRKLKHNIETSHIPVIMLTAQNSPLTERESYISGADGFITKPFDTKVLMARIDNLINSYKQRQIKFRATKEPKVNVSEFQDTDKDFVNSLIECIEKHITDTNMDLEFIASELNVSKSTMNRKIKAITGMTPMDFTRNIRMKVACKMFKNTNKNISEIAYTVGFNNPKYFSTCFKEEFGITPTEFIQNIKSEKELSHASTHNP